MTNKLKNDLIAKSISKLYLNGESSDVKFKFNDDDQTQFVPAHKAILGSASSVFYAMFFGPLKEGDIVEITDARATVFKEFIQFFYLPEVTITMENIGDVIRLADKYDMLDHLNMCVAHLQTKLTDDNMFWGYQLAIELDNQQLKQFCEEKLSRSVSNMLESDAFLRCDQQVLKHFLQMDQMFIYEIDVFNACVAWAKASCRANGLDENIASNLKKQLGDCFYLIRFGAMAKTDIGAIMSNVLYTGLFERDELIDIVRITTDDNYKSTIFSQKSRVDKLFASIKNPELTCKMKQNDLVIRYITNTESTWFSTNKSLALVEFSCPRLVQDFVEKFDISFNVDIIEHDARSFETDEANKVVLSSIIKFSIVENAPKMILPRAVPINPKKMYEIKMSTTDNIDGLCFLETWHPMVKLNEDVEVTFHENPAIENGSGAGLVSTMVFKRI